MESKLNVKGEQATSFSPFGKNLFKIICVLIATCIMVAIVMYPNPGGNSGLTIGGQRAVAVLIWTLIVVITGAIHDAAIGLAILTLLSVLKIGGLTDTLGGLATDVSVLLIGGYILAAAMNKTDLDRRIALKTMSLIGANANLILIGLMAINIIICPFIPATVVKGALMLPIVIGMINAMGYEKGNKKAAAFLLVGVAFGPNIAASSMLTGITTNVITNKFLQDAHVSPLSWGQWFLANWPFTFFYFIVLYILAIKIFKMKKEADVTGNSRGKEYIQGQLAQLGSMKKEEIIVSVMMLLAVCFFLTESYHKISPGIVVIGISALLWMPGIKIMEWKEAEGYVNWGVWLLMVGGMTLGSLLFKTKAAIWIANTTLVAMGIQHLPPIIGLLLMIWFLHIMHMGISSALAMVTTIVPIYLAFAQTVGWDPVVVGLATVLSANLGFILPISTITALQAYGSGYYSQYDQMKIGIPMTLVCDIILILVILFYFPLIGLKLS